jgi:hypothetical protein
MSSFEERLEPALEWELKVGRLFRYYGFDTQRFGQGCLQDAVRHLLRNKTNDFVVSFIRRLPDWIARRGDLQLLVEAKSTSKKRRGKPDYSYELDAYDVGMFFYYLGSKVVVVFNEGGRADYIQNLRFTEIKTSPDEVYDSEGSHTYYGWIPKRSVPKLKDFMDREFGKPPEDQIKIVYYADPCKDYDAVVQFPRTLQHLRHRCNKELSRSRDRTADLGGIAFKMSEKPKLLEIITGYPLYISHLLDWD